MNAGVYTCHVVRSIRVGDYEILTCFPGIDIESIISVSFSFVQSLARHDDFFGIAHFPFTDLDLER